MTTTGLSNKVRKTLLLESMGNLSKETQSAKARIPTKNGAE